MEKSWKKQKFRMIDLKSPAPFTDAALAKNDNLAAGPERIHDDSPFLKCDPHNRNDFGGIVPARQTGGGLRLANRRVFRLNSACPAGQRYAISYRPDGPFCFFC